jgi:hypothetical protein
MDIAARLHVLTRVRYPFCNSQVTSSYMHSGVREDGPRVFNTLLAMARDEEPLR